MKVNWKDKRLWARTGGGVLALLCVVAMVKCGNNADDRDEARAALAAKTARVDTLENQLRQEITDYNNLHDFAQARGDTIRMLRNSTSTEIYWLNDSIEHLVAERDSLQRSLNDCRGSHRSAPARRRKSSGVKGGKSTVKGGRTKSTTVVQQNGCGNTVNVNNGTVNNYYAPAEKPATTPKQSTVHIESSASVTTTYVVRVLPAKTR